MQTRAALISMGWVWSKGNTSRDRRTQIAAVFFNSIFDWAYFNMSKGLLFYFNPISLICLWSVAFLLLLPHFIMNHLQSLGGGGGWEDVEQDIRFLQHSFKAFSLLTALLYPQKSKVTTSLTGPLLHDRILRLTHAHFSHCNFTSELLYFQPDTLCWCWLHVHSNIKLHMCSFVECYSPDASLSTFVHLSQDVMGLKVQRLCYVTISSLSLSPILQTGGHFLYPTNKANALSSSTCFLFTGQQGATPLVEKRSLIVLKSIGKWLYFSLYSLSKHVFIVSNRELQVFFNTAWCVNYGQIDHKPVYVFGHSYWDCTAFLCNSCTFKKWWRQITLS